MPYAPLDAQYLTLAANGELTDYRILTIGNMLVAVDGGPAGPYSLNVDPTQIDHADLDNLTVGNPHTQYMLGTILGANGDILTRVAGSPAALNIGSTGQVLTVSSGLPAWATPATPSPYLAQLPHQSGFYYGPPSAQFTPSTQSVITGFLRAAPFFVPTTTTYDRIAFEVTASAAGNHRLGVWGPITGSYASVPNLLDTGNVSSGTTGVKTATISLQLSPGWYLIGQSNSNTNTVRAIPAAAMTDNGDSTPFGANRQNSYFFVAHTFGALPNPLTGLALAGSTDLMPWVQLRAA